METQLLSIEPKNAQIAFNKGTKEIKDTLINLFSSHNFNRPLKEIITSYESACDHIGQTPLTIENFGFYPIEDRASKFAEHRIETYVKAFNGKDHVFDYTNGSNKYYPRFYWNADRAGGPGFSVAYYDLVHSYSFVGARLSFKNYGDMVFVANQFENDYNTFLSPYQPK